MAEESQWYTNKQLFEHILSMKEDFTSLRQEMRQTREIIKKYNGLREQIQNNKEDTQKKIQELEKELSDMKAKNSGKATVLKGIREWGGWIVAILVLVEKVFFS